jgi:ketosteroid isomerase-like protein
MDPYAVESAVRDAYHRYLEGFHSHDPANVTPHVTIPLTVVASSGRQVFGQRQDVQAWLQGILDRLLAVGYDRTVMDAEDVTVLDDGMALMRVAGSRRDGGGAVLEPIAAVYAMVKEADGSWRIAVMMPFAAPLHETKEQSA